MKSSEESLSLLADDERRAGHFEGNVGFLLAVLHFPEHVA